MEAPRQRTANAQPHRIPHPIQLEMLSRDAQDAHAEYRAALTDQGVYMPEVSLRYLIALVLSEAPQEDLKEFAGQCRTDLNQQRLVLFKQRNGWGG